MEINKDSIGAKGEEKWNGKQTVGRKCYNSPFTLHDASARYAALIRRMVF